MRTFSFVRRLVLLAVLAAALIWGCGDKNQNDGGQIASADTATLEKQLERNVNAVMERLKYDDKSAMWENEFEYLREELTFDDYLKLRPISFAKTDSLSHVEVTSVQDYKDSAVARVVVHFKGLSGAESAVNDTITLYHHGGRWIKPTASSWSRQMSFDSLRQAAIDQAEKEAGE